MPHVIVKLCSGRLEQQKSALAAEITKAVMASTNSAEASVTVSIEDTEPSEWTEKVYKMDIVGEWEKLYKKLGYKPL